MTSPDPFIWLTLVDGEDTQPDHAWLAGRVVGVPVGTDIGSGPTNPGTLQGIRGYPRPKQRAETATTLEWVLSSPMPTAAKAFVHNLPDAGWAHDIYENVYLAMASALIERGIPMEDVGGLIEQLHTAAVENERAHLDKAKSKP